MHVVESASTQQYSVHDWRVMSTAECTYVHTSFWYEGTLPMAGYITPSVQAEDIGVTAEWRHRVNITNSHSVRTV